MTNRNIVLAATFAAALQLAAAETKSYETPPELKYPYVSTYYVKPIVKPDESVKIGFYVTDFEHSKVRFNDDSHRFTVRCRYGIEGGAEKELAVENAKSADGEFELGRLAPGSYRVGVWAVDAQGRESHRVWQAFKVAEPVPEKKYEVTAADLAKYDILDGGDYARRVLVPVTLPEKCTWGQAKPLALEQVDAFIATNRTVVTRGQPGYTVYIAAKDGQPMVRAFERSRVVYDAGYDTNAVEQAAVKTAEGLQRLLDDQSAAGYNRVVLKKGYYRVSAFRKIVPPNGMTFDLNGSVLKENGFTGAKSVVVDIENRHDVHVVNGVIEGDYYEHDYANSPNNSEWPLGITLTGDTSYSSFENLQVRDITGYGGGNGIGKVNGRLHKLYINLGKFAAGGLNRKDGSVDASDKNRFTCDFTDIASAKSNGWLQVSKYLGYQGRKTRSWRMTGAWYDAEKKFLGAETLWQYREVPVPARAQYLRVSVEEASAEAADQASLRITAFSLPVNCAIRNCSFDRCRCVGYAASAMHNQLFEGNEFSHSGEAAAKCAFDAEDGWDQMQDVLFVRNRFHDNPINNSILTCCGHNFILEDNDCDIHFWGRTHSPCVRNNRAPSLHVYCDGRLRSGYARFQNNCITKKLAVDSDKGKAASRGWFVVMEQCRFKDVEFRSLADTLPQYRDCTFDNCKPDEAYWRIEHEVMVSDWEIGQLQNALSNRCSLADYAPLVRKENGIEIWTAALQKALDEHQIVQIPKRAEKYYIDGVVKIPSNRRIEARGATIRLKDGVRTLMLRNVSTKDGTRAPVPDGTRDTNIAVVGGRWEDCCTARAGYGASGLHDAGHGYGNYLGVSTFFLFNNCDHVQVKDVTFVNVGAFSIQVGCADAMNFSNIVFERCFADGLHLNGNLTRVHAKNIRGAGGDDLVALNAYDWLNSSVTFGPQRFILCEDMELIPSGNSGYSAIRLLPAVYRYNDGTEVDCSINDVIMRRVKGVMNYKMYMQTPAYPIKQQPEWGRVGSGGNLFFEKLDIDLKGPVDGFDAYKNSDPVRGHFAAFEFGANLSSVVFRDLDITLHADKYPLSHLATVGPKSIILGAGDGRIEIFDPYVSCTVGKVELDRVRIHGQAPKELVHATVFEDINGDGRSSGKGEIRQLSVLGN